MKNNNRYEYPFIGYLIIGTNALVGIILMSLAVKNGTEAGYSVIRSLLSTSILLPYTLLFVIILIYIIDMHIHNVLIKPKEEILYAYHSEKGEAIFLNKKGHKFLYSNRDSIIKKDNFYKVLKTRDEIVEVLEITSSNYDKPEIKERFWVTWYIPFYGSLKDVMLLPIIYTICFMGLLSCCVGDFSMLIIMVVCEVLIAYDLYYKYLVKKRRDTIKNESMDEITQIENEVNNELEPTMIKIENATHNIKNIITFIIITIVIIVFIGIIVMLFLTPAEENEEIAKVFFGLIMIFFISLLIPYWIETFKTMIKKE